jgi:hypothetical protein
MIGSTLEGDSVLLANVYGITLIVAVAVITVAFAIHLRKDLLN